MNPNEPAYPLNELDQALNTVAVQHFGIPVRNCEAHRPLTPASYIN